MTQPESNQDLGALDALVKDRERRHSATGARFMDKLMAELDAIAARKLAASQMDDNDNFGL